MFGQPVRIFFVGKKGEASLQVDLTLTLPICEAQRQIGKTALNETSSRSHPILRLTIESSARKFVGAENSSSLAATISFVDLAGSECAS